MGQKPGDCEVLKPGTMGICVQKCDDDYDCGGNQKCCSNGCGNTCQTPIKKPGLEFKHYDLNELEFALLKIKKIQDAWKDLEKTQKMSSI
jgi:hypothetical protein